MTQAPITLPAPDPDGPLLHIEQLSDSQIDALLDLYLFGNSPTCYGTIAFQYGGLDTAMYRCQICGAPAERRAAGPYFDSYAHPRLVPSFRIEDIILAMNKRERVEQFVFCHALSGQATGSQPARRVIAVVMGMTTHSVSIAALKALHVVSGSGAILVRI